MEFNLSQILPDPHNEFVKLATNTVPIFCFPELIEKLPISLTYCFLYMLGCVLVIGFGFYLYFQRILKHRTTTQSSAEQTINTFSNGYTNSEQNTVGKQGNAKILRGMLPHGSDSPMHASPVFNGSKSGTRE